VLVLVNLANLVAALAWIPMRRRGDEVSPTGRRSTMDEMILRVNEMREAAAERELAGASDAASQNAERACAVQAALERALTPGVAQRFCIVVFDESKMVSLTDMVTDMRSRSGHVQSISCAAAASGGFSPRWRSGWEQPRESGKGGQEL
jgi:hypothetical protein